MICDGQYERSTVSTGVIAAPPGMDPKMTELLRNALWKMFQDPEVHEGRTFGVQRPLRELGAGGLAESIEMVVLLDHYVPASTVANAARQF